MRQSAIKSFLASATIILVLRTPAALGSCPEPKYPARSLTGTAKVPSELDQPAPDASITDFG